LLGAFTGSEGTLGIVTKIVVKLTPVPEAVHLVLAAYDSLEAGGRAVTDIIAAGIVPAAIEMMDALSIEAAEAAVHCGYPDGAAAVLLVELDGPAAEVEAELATVRAICEAAGAREVRAGEGNLRPLVLYNAAVPGETEAAEAVSGAILDTCIEYGGSITGEHGVG